MATVDMDLFLVPEETLLQLKEANPEGVLYCNAMMLLSQETSKHYIMYSRWLFANLIHDLNLPKDFTDLGW